MLEPYVLKDTRTVLRRGGESNLSNLSDNNEFNIANCSLMIRNHPPTTIHFHNKSNHFHK